LIDYIHAASYVGVVSFLLSMGVLLGEDIRNRKIPQWILGVLILVNVPALWIMYSNGLPIFYLLLSIVMTILFGILYWVGSFKGGDAKVLILISWFCPLNPINSNDTFFQIQFVIFLAAVSIFWMVYVYFKNRHAQDPLSFRDMSLWQKFNNYPGGSPWMAPIAIAFIITAVFG
jgi:Flp pilus assembly protein protease CpaA